MKKLIMVLFAAFFALAYTACSQDPTANVKWTTDSTYYPPISDPDLPGITDIKWEKNGTADQTWSTGLTTASQSTDTKEVTEMTGSGTCLLDGIDAEIEISSASTGIDSTSGMSATLKEDADVNLIIKNATAKKK